MGKDNSGILYKKETRKALGDMTNLIGKRKFQSISKSSIDITLGTDIEYDTNFLKQVAMAVEKFEKENNIQKFPKLSNEIKFSPSKGGEKSRLLNPSIDSRKGLHNARKDMKENSNTVVDRTNLGAGNEGEKLKVGGVSGVKIGESLKCIERVCVDGEEAVVVSDVAENEGSYEVLGTQIVSDSDGNQTVDRLANSKCDMNLNLKFVESQEMQGFGLERCKLLKRDVECIDSNSIKDCSCSFCSKAAFIWSDLHYQDVKGRVAALTKSQKEASNLSEKYTVENVKGGHSSGNFSTAAQLEIDLSHQWSSLFLHMVDTYRTEGSQLQNNFLALKEIRGDYKMNLEMNGMPIDVVQSSSDACEL
ncbi:unnamed protein product [Amaranthus hypochondriacus]